MSIFKKSTILFVLLLISTLTESCDYLNNTTMTQTTTIQETTTEELLEVSFDSLGGNTVDSIFTTNGSSITLPEATREGYTFIGWFTGEEVNDTQFTELSVVTRDITLYAKWVVSDILYGGSSDEAYYDVIVDSDGYIISVGYSSSSDGDIVNGKYGLGDAIITKHDLDGNLIWYKILGGNSSDEFHSVIQDSDGNYIAIGSSHSDDGDFLNKNYGGNDAIMVKFSSDGEVLWINHYGGSEGDHFYDIAEDSDGNYIIVGETYSLDHDIIYGINDLVGPLVMKIDNDGDIVWYKMIGESLVINSVVVDEYDGIFIVGYNNNETRDGYFAKLDSNGSFVWEKSFDLTLDEMLVSIALLPDGNFVVAGVLENTTDTYEGLFVKFDSSGDVVWSKRVESKGYGVIYSITSDRNGNIIGVGYDSDDTWDESSNNGYDGWLVKLDSLGEVILEMHFGGTKDDLLLSAISTDDYIICVGSSFSDDINLLDNHQGNADAWINVFVE